MIGSLSKETRVASKVLLRLIALSLCAVLEFQQCSMIDSYRASYRLNFS